MKGITLCNGDHPLQGTLDFAKKIILCEGDYPLQRKSSFPKRIILCKDDIFAERITFYKGEHPLGRGSTKVITLYWGHHIHGGNHPLWRNPLYKGWSPLQMIISFAKDGLLCKGWSHSQRVFPFVKGDILCNHSFVIYSLQSSRIFFILRFYSEFFMCFSIFVSILHSSSVYFILYLYSNFHLYIKY